MVRGWDGEGRPLAADLKSLTCSQQVQNERSWMDAHLVGVYRSLCGFGDEVIDHGSHIPVRGFVHT